MSQNNGDGIKYPQLTLGGITYLLAFTRGGLLYRISKSGGLLSASGPSLIASRIDQLHAALWGQYNGTPEQLAELVFSENKFAEACAAMDEAWGKASPLPTAAAAAKEPEAALTLADVPLQ